LEDNEQEENLENGELQNVITVSGMYEDWFLDYASYVILERAIPALFDGLKPVQRRIMHSMKDLDDGRYNKVANIIGHTMKYHPHGDASIGDALVQLGQKDLLVDCQGNWGNILTGDSAAAPRYIEARLSKFALDVVFNPKTTRWQQSYDGRNNEPIFLPVKFPLLLAQGAEGIAVGMACKILPHNFIELIDASIDVLKGKKINLLPDFPSGGMADVSLYNEGLRGGKVRVRAKIAQLDTKTLVVNEIPFGTTTSSLIDSIIKANDKGKIKIKKIEDNTSDKVEILVHLAPGISPDKMIDALYAFSDCEVSISPNTAIIEKDKPRFVSVNEMLIISAHNTVDLLKLELEIRKGELEERWHFSSLEKIFIENRIYRDIEECETWEAVIHAIDIGLKPHIKHLKRAVVEEDIIRLTEIKIKRISKFDAFKADEIILDLEKAIAEVINFLNNLTEYAIDYYKNIKKKYGTGRERKTELKHFDNIVASKVVVANKKLYVNREEGFAGHGLRKDEYVEDCSDIDDVIVFRSNGTMKVSRISEKAFFGKDIIHVAVWKKGDDRTTYNLVYQDGPSGAAMIKRFAVKSITRDKDYDLTNGTAKSKILYFTSNPNGEAEIVSVQLRPRPNLKKLKFDYDFSELAIKGRAAKGNRLTKNIISKIVFKEKGTSTLGARKIWYDATINRINDDGRGEFLGDFTGNNKILTISQEGYYKLSSFDLETHFDENLIVLEKFIPQKVVSVVYFDGDKKQYNVKRFHIEDATKKVLFISEHPNSQVELVTLRKDPKIIVEYDKRSSNKGTEEILLSEFISIKGVAAQGNRLTADKIKAIDLKEMTPEEEEEEKLWLAPSEKVIAKEETIDEESPEETDASDEDEKDEDENNDFQASLF
jgi:topoisomerase-4 subunit A